MQLLDFEELAEARLLLFGRGHALAIWGGQRVYMRGYYSCPDSIGPACRSWGFILLGYFHCGLGTIPAPCAAPSAAARAATRTATRAASSRTTRPVADIARRSDEHRGDIGF